MNLLFRFAYGEVIYRFNNGPIVIRYDGADYAPVSIDLSGEFVASSETQKNALRIRVPLENPVSQDYLAQRIAAVVMVTVFELVEEGALVRWKGRITTIDLSEGVVEFVCESVLTAGERNGLSRPYLKQCPYALYSPGQCDVDKTLHEEAGTIAAVDGLTMTVPQAAALPDDWFTGGIIEYQGMNRYVASHVGDQLILNWPFAAVTLDDPITLYPGCSFDRVTCDEKFDNIENYGGQPWMPTDNVFRMTSVV